MQRIFSLLTVLLFTLILSAQQVNIIPIPANMKITKGSFTINASTVLVVWNGVDDNTADFFNDYLKQYLGFKLKKVKKVAPNSIQITTLQTFVPGKEGAYTLTATPKGVNIQGQTASGTFYGMQTLIQLLPVEKSKSAKPAYKIAAVEITDEPRFAYRGMHLDVGRHFFPVSFVKKYIDYLALHKFNTFHWHLTDDQGWRIEIKKYPNLTKAGAWRNGTIIGRYPGKDNDGIKYGGYYTQEQIKDVVAYAQKRFITILPEIEMPGHSSAAIAAYPELSCFPNESTQHPKQCAWSGDSTGKQVQQTWGVFDDVFCAGQENTFKFLEDVMDEVLELFPSKMIHVGGDESPKENWKRCPNCQKRIKDNGLKNEHELQSYFIQRMEKYLNSKSRTLIGWDEILEGGLAPNAIVMSWRGEQGGIDAAKQKHNVVMTPGNPVYFDHTQTESEDSVTIGGYNPIEKVYAYEPIPAELNADDAKFVLGAQANMWSEYMKNPRKVEYMVFPRMAALSEVLWSGKEKRNWEDFQKRLPTQFKRYDLWKANYSKAFFDLKATILPADDYNGLVLKLESKRSTDKIVLNTLFPKGKMFTYTTPFKMTGNTIVSAWVEANGKKGTSISHYFRFNKATGKKITLTTPPSSKYPGNGAFTLVNGIQNEQGLARSREFVGFEGPDCEAVIDMGKETEMKTVIGHFFQEKGSWIWPPAGMTIMTSNDGTNYLAVACSNPTTDNNKVSCEFLQAVKARYIKVLIQNFGVIPEGNPGAGSKPWLFVDEIEVN
jgi:hexosaminidase